MHGVRARGFCVPTFEFSTVRSGTARPVTKPLAGYAGARIVGTISGTAHRPRLHVAPQAALHIAPVWVHIFAYYQEVPHE